jgi:hypothetical protein
MSRDWNGLNREELQVENDRWTADLQTLNIELAAARRRGAQGTYMPVDQLQELELRRARLIRGIQILSRLMAKARQATKLHFSEFFMNAAEDLIEDDDLYDAIYNKAEAAFNAAVEAQRG